MKTEAVQMQTYSDIMEAVTNNVVNSSDDVAADVCTGLLTQRSDIAPAERAFTLMAHARGFHARADAKRQEGNHVLADFLFGFAQHLLELAATEHSHFMAELIDAFEVKH
ncbi:hypothetical protein [Mesorhizobium sp. 1B3]|uniref:hypothetical protein n=1 Tax=Mesorhizobium sp. 1B3 TaxID=3243599 RepID=UPI003D97A48B